MWFANLSVSLMLLCFLCTYTFSIDHAQLIIFVFVTSNKIMYNFYFCYNFYNIDFLCLFNACGNEKH